MEGGPSPTGDCRNYAVSKKKASSIRGGTVLGANRAGNFYNTDTMTIHQMIFLNNLQEIAKNESENRLLV
jgi:hypothetical protein